MSSEWKVHRKVSDKWRVYVEGEPVSSIIRWRQASRLVNSLRRKNPLISISMKRVV